ncbi:uncharacterized protein ACRADG_006296 [Cochliomyia hominivorax]
MNKLETYLILLGVYLGSIALMLFDLHFTVRRTLAKRIFYLMSNGVLILRVLGNFWSSIVIHATMPFILLFLLAYNRDNLIVLTILLFLLGFFGTQSSHKAFYTGIHAQMGLVTVIYYFWVIEQVMKESSWCGIASMGHMLTFFIIVLTPGFQGVAKSVLKRELTEDETVETITTINTEYGPIALGHRREFEIEEEEGERV